MLKNFVRAFVLLILCVVVSITARAQTYTNNEFIASSPLAWQVQSDPAGRLVVGNDDGYVFAFPNLSTWASTIKCCTAQGVAGLLYDLTITPEGPPQAFGLARRGCNVTDAASASNCIRAAWSPVFDSTTGTWTMGAVVSYPDGTVELTFEPDVHQGDSLSIERAGNTINFYRSTSVSGERRRVHSSPSPFVGDGFDPSTPVEPRAAFSPSAVARKVAASELYYCCL